jgi:uncharacterized protein
MKKLWVVLIALCGVSACTDTTQQQYLDDNGIPKPTASYVNDFTGSMLDTAQVSFLNHELKAYEDSTSNQLVVILLKEIPKNKNGDTWTLEEFTLATARTWKIGQKGKNNGVLFFAALDDKKDRIEVGYGLEGALPDIICAHILEKEVKPAFKDEHYYDGVKNAISAIQRSIAGEYQQEVQKQEAEEAFWTIYLIALAVCAVLGAFLYYWQLILAMGGLCGGVGWYFETQLWGETILATLICAAVVLLASTILRAATVGIDGDGEGFLFAGGGGGSSSSGGFSGGGGSFGGGGASGGW